MPRPLWTGSIGFGLVNIPVKLFKARSSKDIRFHQLHEKDGVRIQQKRVCPADDAEVPYDEVVKGFEISPDRYVIIDANELSALDPKATHSIDIVDFVDLDEIDPLYYENAYYVAPDTRAEKPYGLLAAAMADSNKVAIARFVMRTKEYLCAVRAKDGVLLLETMLFADEVISAADLSIAVQEAPAERELQMAKQLIESLVSPFEPEKYHDEYREKVEALIAAKAEGNEIVTQPEAAPTAPVLDLMAALEASLAAAEAAKTEARKSSKRGAQKETRAHA